MALSVYKWLILSLTSMVHPFFVSVTEINHNAKDKTLEISCKMFLDDTEKALQKQTNSPVELSTPKDKEKAGQLLASYVKKHLQVKVDGKLVNLEFIGYETEGASVWSYYQASNVVAPPHKVEVMNNILYELYDTQISIVHVQVAGNKKSSRVVYPDSNLNFDF